MTKYHPILFSTPMVQAIIQGRKTMTRRTKKLEFLNNTSFDYEYKGIHDIMGFPMHVMRSKEYGSRNGIKCPYGLIGDILWVRETWRGIEQDCGSERFEYKASEYINLLEKWKPSIHMPKVACRMFLKITGIRIERLHDITPGDACDEGIEYWNIDGEALAGGELVADFKNYMWRDDVKYADYHFPTYANCVASFLSLWEKINGRESLEANPWVWVISFERIEKPKHDRHE